MSCGGNKEGRRVGKAPKTYIDDDIVISGTAGRFPESNNMQHFKENLFNKVDLVTNDDRRWKLDHPEIPQRTGKVNNVSKFDSLFFGVHFKQAHTMDPMCRMLLEHAYEAIVDAGLNPRQLRGTKTGIFIGACFSESEKTWFYEKLQVNGFGITGCSRAMLANRIAYWLGSIGPSYTVDSACSSSLFAMENAYRAMRDGLCDSALVGGANLCLHPYVSLQFSRLGVLSADGCCRSFDASASGYARSEAIGMVFLQRAKDAKRIYATFVHAKTNSDGYKEQGITFPSSVMQSALLKEFYEECNVPPSELAYVEAHGTGTKVGDPEEVNALDRILCPGRTTPLRIGSVKSNLGHSEPASGVCSICKVVICMETGMIVPNLHYVSPREGVKALEEGRIKVISELTPWEGGYVGVNSFGFGGANAHILLKSHEKEKINHGAPKDDLPRLVTLSGRTEEAVDYFLKDVESRPVDAEFIRLIQDIHDEEIPGHIYRGYTVVGGSATSDEPLKEIKDFQGKKRPVWFVFSGMGSQWPTMGSAFLRFPVFAEAIKKCDAALKPRGVDIYHILTNNDKTIFDNILNSFVGIAAVQIGLVDLLTSIGIVPDKIIGHSVGELGCAYADGCFTAEQMILSAYSRGLASLETAMPRGSMAAVGVGYSKIKGLCPPDIEVACHNGPDSATISGPAESMKAFVAKLQSNNIFAREVPCGNIAYHSRYIAPAGPKLLAYLKKVIPEPKARSSKWVSTSLPRGEWGTAKARFSSAEYHTNNLLNAVLFEETSVLIPSDAITIEIAPHGLLQAILRRSLDASVTNIALTKRGHKDNAEVFLQGIGKLFNVGLQPQISRLFPDVQFPVSRGTPMISPLIKWEHRDDWYVTSYRMQEKIDSGERTVEVTLGDEDYEFMSGHIIDSRNLIPATAYLCWVWETVGMMRGELYTEVSVVFEDVKFLRATNIPKEGVVNLTLMVQKGTGRFEVVEGGAAVATGIIRVPGKISQEMMNINEPDDGEPETMLSRDIYKELKLRGYHYKDMFKGLKSITIDGSKGTIAWANNFVAFIDNMLQVKIFGFDTRGLFVPTGIQKLTIDTKTHSALVRNLPADQKELPVRLYKDYDAIVSGGIEIRGLKSSAIARKKPTGEPVIEYQRFVANRDGAEVSLEEFMTLAGHVVAENHSTLKMKILEAVDDAPLASDLISPHLREVLSGLPLVQASMSVVGSSNPYEEGALPSGITFVETKKLTAGSDALILCGRGLLSSKTERLGQLMVALTKGGFVLTRETGESSRLVEAATRNSLEIVLEKRSGKEMLLLLRPSSKNLGIRGVVKIASDNFDWFPELQSLVRELGERKQNNDTRIILVSDRNYENGLCGLIKCLQQEMGDHVFRGFLLQDKNAPEFSASDKFYADQLRLDLVVNVLRPDGVWGTYRHLKMAEIREKPTYHVWMNQLVRGDLSSLQWLEGPMKPSRSSNRARIVYSSINFRDVMLTTGKLAVEVVAKNRDFFECPFGFEYSGVDDNSRRVMGLVECRGFANMVECDELTWTIPDDWSFEDAATVPCVYATCYYALYFNGKMKRGDKVLIHAGSGGVGQAAINLALHEGCEVFTTVGTPDKRRFIREHFPQIDDSHIGNSRDTSFEEMIIRETQGRGVDIVLNSLSEEKLQASVRCLAERGRFLEIGKVDMAANNALGMGIFLKEISFHSVMLDNLLAASATEKVKFQKLFETVLKSGAVKPLTRTVFQKNEIETAFRHMAAGKHIGKVLIDIRGKSSQLDSPILAIPRFYADPDGTYVVFGGLGGFGLELADMLILRGAKNIVLTSRRGIGNGYQSRRIDFWRKSGTKVVVMVNKGGTRHEECLNILLESNKIAPVVGIFNLAAALKDALFQDQTLENFEISFNGKAWTTKILDQLTRVHCPKLKHFVVFSSVVSGRGNAGQTNYGMANSVMERICERRFAEGLPALAIQWGAIGDVGLVADMYEEHKELVISGTLQQRITSCLEELDKFLVQNDHPVVGSMVVAEKRAGGGGSRDIVESVIHIMGLKDLKSISTQTSLAELGMDSMMAVEIKQTLEREYEVFLTPQDIRALNFAKIMDIGAKLREEKKRSGKTDDEESPSVMKLLLQVIGDKDLTQDVCVSLETKQEAGRDEVFLIPGIEGYASIFRNFASDIRSPATGLQFINDDNIKTIFDMAEQFLPHVLQRNRGRRDFVIAGYSFGSLPAIELARKLEAEGLTGRLVLIDGSPNLMKAIKAQQLMTDTDDDLQKSMLVAITDIILPAFATEMATELAKCTTWTERLDHFISTVDEKGVKIQRLRDICIGMHRRLTALDTYNPEELPPLRSSIILLKPTCPSAKLSENDYGLSKLTREAVEIHVIDANHLTILQSRKIIMAINGEPLEDADAFKAKIMEDGKILAAIQDNEHQRS